MSFKHAPCATCAALATSALAQVSASDLAKPPADARHFVVKSLSVKHGDSRIWLAPDGAPVGRENVNLHGQIWEMDDRSTVGADGMPSTFVIRGSIQDVILTTLR